MSPPRPCSHIAFGVRLSSARSPHNTPRGRRRADAVRCGVMRCGPFHVFAVVPSAFFLIAPFAFSVSSRSRFPVAPFVFPLLSLSRFRSCPVRLFPVLPCTCFVFRVVPFAFCLLHRSCLPCCPIRVAFVAPFAFSLLPPFAFSLLSFFRFPCCAVRVPLLT